MGRTYNSAGVADALFYFIKDENSTLEHLGCSFLTMDR